jgi:transcription termination/antitermination protein NusG
MNDDELQSDIEAAEEITPEESSVPGPEEASVSLPADSEPDELPEPEAEPALESGEPEEKTPDMGTDDDEESSELPEEPMQSLTHESTDMQSLITKQWPGSWYVLHTYSGYEDAVADSLKQRITSLDMQDKIFDVLVPKENQIEIKNGKRKVVEKKMFPGYVLVNMNVTEDSWYVVRNTPNVTGFIGSGTIPVPVTDAELKSIFKRMDIEEPKYKIDLSVGELVNIKDGPFKNYDGAVSEIDEEKGKIKVLVSIFGRETPVELDFLQVKKV